MGGGCHFYPRAGLVNAPLTALASYVVASGKKLLVGTDGSLLAPLRDRCFAFGIEDFGPEDYRHLCELFFGSKLAGQLDFAKIHRFAPKLDAHQLRLPACGADGSGR